jgi:hypothetical protein
MAEINPIFLAGQFEGLKDLIKLHADSSEKRFDRVEDKLEQQDQQHDKDKDEAIQARETRHAENLARFKSIEEKTTETFGIASENRTWIADFGKPLELRVGKLEKADLIKQSKAAGAAIVWGSLASAITILMTVIGGLIALKHGGLAGLAEFLHGG